MESAALLLDRGDASDLTWASGYAGERRKESAVDVRSIEDVAPVVEHNGTVPVWWMIKPGEMTEITKGGHLELVNEFDVEGGGLGRSPTRTRPTSSITSPRAAAS